MKCERKEHKYDRIIHCDYNFVRNIDRSDVYQDTDRFFTGDFRCCNGAVYGYPSDEPLYENGDEPSEFRDCGLSVLCDHGPGHGRRRNHKTADEILQFDCG